MAVNKNIWETKKTFTINNATFEQSKSIDELFTDKKLILNSDFDRTIYMWDRDPVIYNFYRLNSDRTPEICAYNSDKRTAITLGYSDSESGYFPVGFPPSSSSNVPLTYAMRPDQKEDTRPKYGNVITDFDYKTIVFCIYVKATNDSAPKKPQTFPLKTYFDSQYND